MALLSIKLKIRLCGYLLNVKELNGYYGVRVTTLHIFCPGSITNPLIVFLRSWVPAIPGLNRGTGGRTNYTGIQHDITAGSTC